MMSLQVFDIINFDDEYLYFILDDKHFIICVAELKNST